MKTSVDRIPYYLCKVAEFGSIHPSKKRNPYRHQRLMNYKYAMHQIIESENPEAYKRYKEGK